MSLFIVKKTEKGPIIKREDSTIRQGVMVTSLSFMVNSTKKSQLLYCSTFTNIVNSMCMCI